MAGSNSAQHSRMRIPLSALNANHVNRHSYNLIYNNVYIPYGIRDMRILNIVFSNVRPGPTNVSHLINRVADILNNNVNLIVTPLSSELKPNCTHAFYMIQRFNY